MKSMKKSIMSIIMSVIIVLGLTGCQTSKGTSVADDVDKAYPDAVSVLQKGWDQIPEQFRIHNALRKQLLHSRNRHL